MEIISDLFLKINWIKNISNITVLISVWRIGFDVCLLNQIERLGFSLCLWIQDEKERAIFLKSIQELYAIGHPFTKPNVLLILRHYFFFFSILAKTVWMVVIHKNIEIIIW